VNYGGATDPGHYTYPRNSAGGRITSDWDLNYRDQPLRGCVGIDYAPSGDPYVPMRCGTGYVAACVVAGCNAGSAAEAWSYHRNGDNNAHNLSARAYS